MALRQERPDPLFVVVFPDHCEEAAAVRLLRPRFPDVLFLRSVGSVPEVSTFVLDDERAVVGEFAHEVRVEFARRGLEPESVLAVLCSSMRASTARLGGTCRERGHRASIHFGTLKTKRVPRCRYRTQSEVRWDLFRYIEVLYNRKN